MAIPTLSMRNPGALGSKVAGSRWFEQEKKKSIPRVQAFILQQNCIYSLNVLCRAWQRAWAELWTFLSGTGVSGLIPRQQCLRFPEKGLWFLWFLVCSYLGTVSGSWGMSLSSWGCWWLQGTSVPPVEPRFSPGSSFWGTVNILCSHCLSAPPPVGDLGFPTSLVLRSCARPRKLWSGSPQPAKGISHMLHQNWQPCQLCQDSAPTSGFSFSQTMEPSQVNSRIHLEIPGGSHWTSGW